LENINFFNSTIVEKVNWTPDKDRPFCLTFDANTGKC